MHELAPIVCALARHRPRRLVFRRHVKRAAIAAILRESDQGTQILVIERAQRRGDPWSGHLGLPGGRLEQADAASGSQAAIRETGEELGLTLAPDAGIGRLSDVLTLDHARRAPLVLSPFVYRWPTGSDITPNHEVAAWQWITLGWLDEPAHRGSLAYRRYGLRARLPSYDCGQGRVLWGLTLIVVDELLRVARRGRGN